MFENKNYNKIDFQNDLNTNNNLTGQVIIHLINDGTSTGTGTTTTGQLIEFKIINYLNYEIINTYYTVLGVLLIFIMIFYKIFKKLGTI